MKNLLLEQHQQKRKETSKEGIYFDNDTEGIRVDRVNICRGCLTTDLTGIKKKRYDANYLYIHFILEGNIDIRHVNENTINHMSTDQIWQIMGDDDYFNVKQLTYTEKKLTIIIPKKLLESWRKDAQFPSWLDDRHLKKGHIQQITLGKNHKKIMLMAQQLLDMAIDTLAARLVFKSNVLSLCATILQQQNMVHSTNFTDHALAIIHMNPMAKWRLVDLAKQVGTNEFYLKQSFKEKTGVSIGRYMRNLRLKEALNLILHHNLSTKEAAYKAGYTDVSYFARIFKEEYGYTPSDLSLK